MHTGDYIRSVKFDKSVGGYKVADVEMFLDEVADDFDKLVEQNRALAERLNTAMQQLQEGNFTTEKQPETEKKAPVADNSGSIQNVQNILVSAQRFSDQIVNEANEKAAEILEEANSKAKDIDEKVATVLNAFEKDIAERKANADKEISTMLNNAAVKSEGIITAAHDSVARQQLLFDKLKVQVSEFKKVLFENHKEQLEILQKFPDTVPYDPEHAAKALEFEVDSEPDFRAFLPNTASEEVNNKGTFDAPEVEAEAPVVTEETKSDIEEENTANV